MATQSLFPILACYPCFSISLLKNSEDIGGLNACVHNWLKAISCYVRDSASKAAWQAGHLCHIKKRAWDTRMVNEHLNCMIRSQGVGACVRCQRFPASIWRCGYCWGGGRGCCCTNWRHGRDFWSFLFILLFGFFWFGRFFQMFLCLDATQKKKEEKAMNIIA